MRKQTREGNDHYIKEFPSTTLHKLAFPLPHYLPLFPLIFIAAYPLYLFSK